MQRRKEEGGVGKCSSVSVRKSFLFLTLTIVLRRSVYLLMVRKEHLTPVLVNGRQVPSVSWGLTRLNDSLPLTEAPRRPSQEKAFLWRQGQREAEYEADCGFIRVAWRGMTSASRPSFRCLISAASRVLLVSVFSPCQQFCLV